MGAPAVFLEYKSIENDAGWWLPLTRVRGQRRRPTTVRGRLRCACRLKSVAKAGPGRREITGEQDCLTEAGGAEGKWPFWLLLFSKNFRVSFGGFEQAWKKIEETKKKATEIIQVRQRNAEASNYKQQLQMQREQEERELALRNQQLRLNQKEAIRNQQMTQAEKNYREAERLKAERAQHEEMIRIQKKTEELKAQGMKQMVRN